MPAGEKASEGRFAFLNQVHGNNIAVIEDEKQVEKPGFYHFLKADGIVTNISHLTLLVMTADCLSIFFIVLKRGPEAQKPASDWVGLAHAGWRGTRQEIARKTISLLRERSGCRPEDIFVAFGPVIGSAHYEVGSEFQQYFPASTDRRRLFDPQPALRRINEKWLLDLACENTRQLREAGIPKAHLVNLKICTVDENSHFYSSRKEKDAAGRMISFITKI